MLYVFVSRYYKRVYVALQVLVFLFLFLFLPRPLPFSPFPSLSAFLEMSAHTRNSPSSTQSTVGKHYRVGEKIREGSHGVVFEGPSPLSPTSTPRILPDLAPYPRRQPA